MGHAAPPPVSSDPSPSRPRVAQTAHRTEISCASRLIKPMPMAVQQKHPRFMAGFDGKPRSRSSQVIALANAKPSQEDNA